MAEGHPSHTSKLIINKKEHEWPNQFIDGAQILQLAGSPNNWVVNQVTSGPGVDPEIGATQQVDLDPQAEPKGVKRFTTRKPATSPGK